MNKDRNELVRIDDDIEFLIEMDKMVTENNIDYLRVMIKDWIHELEEIKSNLEQ